MFDKTCNILTGSIREGVALHVGHISTNLVWSDWNTGGCQHDGW